MTVSRQPAPGEPSTSQSPAGQPDIDAAAGVRSLANLLLFQERIRDAPDLAALASLTVNDASILTAFDIGVFWSGRAGRGSVVSVSGLAEPAKQAPFTHWVQSVCAALSQQTDAVEPVRVAARDVAASLQDDWSSFLPPNVTWVPLPAPGERIQGGLLLARRDVWRDEELRILSRVGRTVGHAAQALLGRRRDPFRYRSWRVPAGIGAVLVVAGLMFVPVRLTVLAPGEVVPLEPHIVRAPLAGVIEEVLVTNNQLVEPGDVLLRLDDTTLRAQLEVASQEYEIASAEYRRSQQSASVDREASSSLQVLSARVYQKRAEVDYVRGQLDKVVIRAGEGGIVLSPGRDRLDGIPVRQGEKLLTIADPHQVEVEAWLPVDDRVPFDDDAPLDLYLNIRPDLAYEATLRTIDFEARPSPAGVLAFRVRAALAPGSEVPRVGARGSARLHGQRVPLYQFLFRKPWAAARPWLGI